jgi:hypothetical protein
MTAPMTDLSCPVCGAELALDHLFVDADNRAAVARLVAAALPLGGPLLQYTRLFAPPKTSLTQRKQVRIILQLLPDLERRAITHRGRDWAVPLGAWAQGIDQMLQARDAGRLELPMKGHGYLYAILTSLADKQEAVAEANTEAAKRHPVSTVAGQGATHPAAMPDAIRQQIATLKNLGVKAP